MNTEDNIPELCEKLDKWISHLKKYGDKWAVSKALFESLEDKRKPLIAKLMMKYDEKSNAAKEQMALADNEFDIFLNGLTEVRKNYLQAQVDYDVAKVKVDALRTLISARKEEVKQFKG